MFFWIQSALLWRIIEFGFITFAKASISAKSSPGFLELSSKLVAKSLASLTTSWRALIGLTSKLWDICLANVILLSLVPRNLAARSREALASAAIFSREAISKPDIFSREAISAFILSAAALSSACLTVTWRNISSRCFNASLIRPVWANFSWSINCWLIAVSCVGTRTLPNNGWLIST